MRRRARPVVRSGAGNLVERCWGASSGVLVQTGRPWRAARRRGQPRQAGPRSTRPGPQHLHRLRFARRQLLVRRPPGPACPLPVGWRRRSASKHASAWPGPEATRPNGQQRAARPELGENGTEAGGPESGRSLSPPRPEGHSPISRRGPRRGRQDRPMPVRQITGAPVNSVSTPQRRSLTGTLKEPQSVQGTWSDTTAGGLLSI